MANLRMTRRWINFGAISTYLSFAVFAFIVLLPIYWMLRSAFSQASDLIKVPPIYFPNPTLKNFQTLMTEVPFVQYTLNSLIFAVSTTLVTLIVGFTAKISELRVYCTKGT